MSLSFCLFCLLTVKHIDSHTILDVDRLLTHLFTDSGYNKHIRPTINQSVATQVSVYQSISYIEELDVASGNLLAIGSLRLVWYDELLVWNASEFGGITKLTLPRDHIWKPELVLISATSKDGVSVGDGILSNAWVDDKGEIFMTTVAFFRTKCTTDTSRFPFDSHGCTFRFGCNGYDISDINFTSSFNTIGLFLREENPEWVVEQTEGSAYELINGKTAISAIVNKITLKRRPTFILIHSFLPLILLLVLCIVSSYVPADSGERLSFSITVFLSFTVMSSSFLANLPRNSIQISLSSYLTIAGNVISTLGVLWSVIIVRLSKRTEAQYIIPKPLVKITLWMKKRSRNFEWPQRGKFAKNRVCNIKENEIDNSVTIADITDDIKTDKEYNKESEVITPEGCSVSWSEVADTLDMLYFTFTLMLVPTLLILFFIAAVVM